MSGIFVFFSSPAQSSVIGRRATISGGISAFQGSVWSVEMQFGSGGPVVSITNPNGVARSGYSWGFDGLIPNNIRPGQSFQVFVRASGTMVIGFDNDGGPITQEVSGEAIRNYVLENITPVLTVDPFQSPVGVLQTPYPFSISGSVSEANPAVYGVPLVHYRIGNGPLTSVPVSQGRWSAPLSLQPGDHQITVQASDRFASVASLSTTLTVLRYQMPSVTDPNAKKTNLQIPTTSSVTSWTRLEPQVADANIGVSSNARLFDPLWLMTRQWQVGEFQGEDTGTPVQARVRATTAPLTRCVFGELSSTNNTALPYDPMRAPLETLVERRQMRAADANDVRMLSLAVEAGLHFLRMVELNATAKKYRPAFLATYVLQQLPAQKDLIDDDNTLRFVQTMVGRAPDARRLASAFRPPSTTQIVFDPALKITAADLPAVQQVATAWLAWYDGLFTEPATAADDAWTPARLEYGVSVATRLSDQPQDGITLSASEFDGGRLDWSSFDVNRKFTIDTTGDRTFEPLNETTVPAPVTFPGAPAARFWEMEDAKVAYGLVPVGPTDLAHLLMIEYASSFGNDWFVVPVTIPVGSVTRVDSLVVTDTFGVRSLVRPIGDPALPNPYFSMWQQTGRRYAGDQFGTPVSNRFFLPPTIGRSIDGAVLEDVLLMRDEMANLAWGIERSIEGATETSVLLSNGSASSFVAPAAGATPRYVVSTTVPGNWIPLLPVRVDDEGAIQGLRRGAVLEPDGSKTTHPARSEALNASASLLLVYDEEIPREGVHITRRRRMTRWIDGSTWVWTAFRNDVGTGEGSAGLRFDALHGGDQP